VNKIRGSNYIHTMKDKTSKGHRQRLKERFLKDENCFRDEKSLLELLLTYSIPRKDVQPIAKALIKKFNDISAVLNASFDELSQIQGIGENSAILIKLIDTIQSHISSQPSFKKLENKAKNEAFQLSLFESENLKENKSKKTRSIEKQIKPFRERGVELFANALMKETISILPDLPDTDSLEIARQTIKDNLHFSAETTRRRNSLYIVQRMFPEGIVDRSLRLFSNQFRNRDELKDVCLYRFLNAEPLLGKVIEELIIPNIGVGFFQRERIKDFLEKLFPKSKSISHGTKAISNVLVSGGLAQVNRGKFIFSYRNIPFASFVFVFFSEFPEPGMYELNKIEENQIVAQMLWKPDQILPMTYELRNKGFISKISEIDNFRQFTTKWNLEQAIERLITMDNKN